MDILSTHTTQMINSNSGSSPSLIQISVLTPKLSIHKAPISILNKHFSHIYNLNSKPIQTSKIQTNRVSRSSIHKQDRANKRYVTWMLKKKCWTTRCYLIYSTTAPSAKLKSSTLSVRETHSTRALPLRIIVKASVFSSTIMVEFMKVNGRMTNAMDAVSSNSQTKASI